MTVYTPTAQQSLIIDHEGSAFVSACPGAGKTRCIISRAEKSLANTGDRRGLAFLSFTNAAVSELETRLVAKRLLPHPPIPHFIGTFDSFFWHFLVAPFGLENCDVSLKLIPDTGDLMVHPFPNGGGQGLPLNCFDRNTGQMDVQKVAKFGFKRNPDRHQTASINLRKQLLKKGYVDFDDAREIANANLQNAVFSDRLAEILSARFKEVIVDEAQDCNPDDLTIVAWLRDIAKIPTKVVCDPNQSIYGFRGGVAGELFDFADTFATEDKLPLTGNFRSTENICKVVHSLRSPSIRGECDSALGELGNENVAIQLLSYAGSGVSSKIGAKFAELADANNIPLDGCRLVAKTRKSGIKAVGGFSDDNSKSTCLRLARASKNFQHATTTEHQLKAVTDAHRIALEIESLLEGQSYHQALEENDLDDLSWRGAIVDILRTLQFDGNAGHNRAEWVDRARAAYSRYLPDGGGTIAQKLQNLSKLDPILLANPTPDLCPSTIHEVKGKQYLGVCVVLTTAKAKAILTHLESEPDQEAAEDCREFYVATSRAQKLLAIACPKSQTPKLIKHLTSFGATIEVTDV